MDSKEIELAPKESEGSQWTPTKCLEWYIYSDIHKVLFFEFPIVLHEWLCKLETQQKKFLGRITERVESILNRAVEKNKQRYIKGCGLLGRQYPRRIYY